MPVDATVEPLAFVPRGPLSGVTQRSADLLKPMAGRGTGTKLGWRGRVHPACETCTGCILTRGGRRREPGRGNARDTGAAGTGLRGAPSSGGPFPPQVRAAPDDQL